MVILIQDGFDLDLTEGYFADLLGYKTKVLGDVNNSGDSAPNIMRGVDLICIHCNLISRPLDNIGADMIYSLATDDLRVSYPFSREPRHLLWHPVNKSLINSINVRITDGITT